MIHGGWKNSGEIGFSLFTSAEFDTKDAIYLDCDLKQYQGTRASIGRGPSLAELKQRRGEREVLAAKRLGSDILQHGVVDMTTPEPEKKKSRKEKEKEKMQQLQISKSNEEKGILKIRKKERISATQMIYHVLNSDKGRNAYLVKIANDCSCSCPYSKKNKEIYCKHICFIVLHVLKGGSLIESLMGRYFGDDDLKNLFDSGGPNIPQEYSQQPFAKKSRADMTRFLAASPNFLDVQTWSMAPKMTRQGKCFHCKKEFAIGDLCLQVEGALVLPFNSTVAKKQLFVACVNDSCYSLPPPWTNIREPLFFADEPTRVFFQK